MRKPIVHMSFHPSVKGWTYDQFVERYKDQLTEDEITHFATSLGLVSEPAAGSLSAPATSFTVPICSVLTAEEIDRIKKDYTAKNKSMQRQLKKRRKTSDNKTDGGE